MTGGCVSLDQTIVAPPSPGVYRFWSESNRVLYVGKARNLKHRLAQYRTGRESDQRINIALLLKNKVVIDWIVTSTEKEALILEDVQIKEFRPRYNIRMRDDKAFLYLRVTTEHPFPRMVRVRRPAADLETVFGPYPSAEAVRTLERLVQKVLPLRTCKDSKFNNRSRPCLEHQIGRCSAPCTGLIDRDSYAALIRDLKSFLSGKSRQLRHEWQHKMQQASAEMAYESAARYRDLVQAADTVWESQIVEIHSGKTVDAIAFGWNDEQWAAAVIGTASGKVITKRAWGAFPWQGTQDETISRFLVQYYSGDHTVPGKILLAEVPEEKEALEELLSERRGKTVKLVQPKRGEGRSLLELAALQAGDLVARADGTLARLEALKRVLKLSEPPRRIECFDISEIQGTSVVGGNVVFLYGDPEPTLYHRYKIRDGAPDDFGRMYEMLCRRIKRAIRDADMPDLIVIDGGKGQLNATLRAFSDLETEPPLLAALAKARTGKQKAEQGYERLFLPGRSNPILLQPGGLATLLLAHIRDETHKYVIGYHRKMRSDSILKGLEQIAGIGVSRRSALRKAYPNLADLYHANTQDITNKSGLPLSVAEEVVQWFSNKVNQMDQEETETSPPETE